MLFLILFFVLQQATSQPDYSFTSRTHESGTDLQIGAVYLYQNVKSGTDARVTIINMTGGISLTDIDGSGGFTEALQPVISNSELIFIRQVHLILLFR